MSDERALHEETRRIWDANARFWDGRYGEGNDFQRLLIGPATERLLQLQPGERVLDVACGNGAFARRMAALGCQVLACDFSQVFLACAQARMAHDQERITYRLVDATDAAQLRALGKHAFDAVVCSMGLMDMSDVEPLMSAVPQLLRPGGRFVFSVMHPCFNSLGTSAMLQEADQDGQLVETRSVVVTRYLSPMHGLGLGIVGQPEPQYYFHRPLSLLLGAAFRAGLAMDGIEEPAFNGEESGARALSWGRFAEIPPVLVVRLKPCAGEPAG
ncbi:MAG: class I SAM-dependent methyltransferase [Anaerolineae bacterium]|nr:class I SAM-dependent methyltransferase [Anaerolineae bacterium]